MENQKKLSIEYVAVDALIPYDKNPRRNDSAVPKVAASIKDFGFKVPLVIDEKNVVVCGHTRLRAVKKLTEDGELPEGLEDGLPCIRAKDLTPEQIRAFRLADNKVSEFAEWDVELLGEELRDLPEFDFKELGFQDSDIEFEADLTKYQDKQGKLADRFVVPPLSILYAYKGDWMNRKRWWKKLIADKGQSRTYTLAKKSSLVSKYGHGVSILDPVMSEIVLRWFAPETGKAFDCFAGDSVFGYVAAKLGFDFTGIELREEQALYNNQRVEGMNARYINDDGQNVAKHIKKKSQDILFSCPPYFDLEKYSDKPNDASNQDTYEGFIGILRNAFTSAVGCLKDDRFAVIVVGDVRDHNGGFYYDFPGDIKRIFRDAGMKLYNELILITPFGTSCLRCGGAMNTRKIVKIHQNVLVFYKGDPANIKKNYKEINYDSTDLERFWMGEGGESEETEEDVQPSTEEVGV